MAKLLVFAVFLTLVIVGLCKNSENCQLVLRNKTSDEVWVRMDITADFKVKYNKTVNGTIKTAEANFSINCTEANDNLNGEYTPEVNKKRNLTMNIPWGDDDYVLTYEFEANYKKGSKQWEISEVSLSVDTGASEFKNATNDETNATGTISGQKNLFGRLDYKRYYYCNSENTLDFKLKNQKVITSMSATISHFKVQAFEFNNSTKGDFGSAARCSKDIKGSKIVPIAVGAALAGLVIIVLVAYIIGRLRSRKQSSYEALS